MKKTFFLLFIFLLSISANTSFAGSVSSMPNGGVVVVHPDCTTTEYPSIQDDDIARGDALRSAVNDIQTGGEFGLGLSDQNIYLTPGTFDIDDTTIDLSKGLIPAVLSNNNLHGSGKELTTIASSVHGASSPVIIKPALNSQITDLKIASIGGTDYSFPFGLGAGQDDYTHGASSFDYGTIFLKNVKLTSPTDGIYFNPDGPISMILNVINLTSISDWDTIAMIGGSGLTLNIYNSDFTVTGNSFITSTNFHGINDLRGMNFNIYNSTFNVTGRDSIYGIYTKGIANIFNTTFTSQSTNGSTPHDLFNYESGNIKVSPSVTYNAVGSSGNITSIAEQTPNVPNPPALACPNPFSSKPTIEISMAASSISTSTAILHANLSDDGLVTPTILGFHYGTSTDYGITSSSTGSFSVGAFSKTLSGLTCSTTYHYRAFAINSVGTGTTTDQIFTTSDCPVVISPPINTETPSYSGRSGSFMGTLVNFMFPGFNSNQNNKSNIDTINNSTTTNGLVNRFYLFNTDLYFGQVNDDVKRLQQFLNSNNFIVSKSGAGSPGNETKLFGPATKKALIDFQITNKIKPASGYFGPKTRNFILESKK